MADLSRLLGILCVLLVACKVVQPSSKCKFYPDQNLIVGKDKRAKEFCEPRLYIPGCIDNLQGRYPLFELEHVHFHRNAPFRFIGYTITGCADTTWAKETMAEHLKRKYKASRTDSSFLRTNLKLSIINEDLLDNHLLSDSCDYSLASLNKEGYGRVDIYKCFKWLEAVELFLPPEYNYKKYKIIYDGQVRSGRYELILPIGLVDRKGFEAYNDYLMRDYGVRLDSIGTDTVHVSVYRYNG